MPKSINWIKTSYQLGYDGDIRKMVEDLYKKKRYSLKKCGEICKVTDVTFHNLLVKLGIKRREAKAPFGNKNNYVDLGKRLPPGKLKKVFEKLGEKTFLQLAIKDGYSPTEISGWFNCTPSTIRKRLRKHKIKKLWRGQWVKPRNI